MPNAIPDKEGFKFYFYSNEGNEPPHVHVFKGSGAAKIWITALEVELESHYDFKKPELKKAIKLTFENRHQILNSWNEHIERHRNR